MRMIYLEPVWEGGVSEEDLYTWSLWGEGIEIESTAEEPGW